ncbi:MAG: hypothetical protein ABI639_13625, partial [Thermoanaerobaculia bacterium]
MNRSNSSRFLRRAAGAASGLFLASSFLGAAPRAIPYDVLLNRVAPAIVSVKVVLKTEYNMGDTMQEQ